VRGQCHAPAEPYPQERPGTHFTGGWVGLRAGLDECGKSPSHQDSIPGPSSPIVSRFTDYATLPTHLITNGHNSTGLAERLHNYSAEDSRQINEGYKIMVATCRLDEMRSL